MFSPSHRYRILYVGGDLSLLTFLKDALQRQDCFVVRCPDGCQARLFIKSGINYSLLLFDNKLPDTTGKELERFARSLKHREQTPILILKQSDDLARLVQTIIQWLAKC